MKDEMIENIENNKQKKAKKTASWAIIMKRELKSFFTGPMAWVVGIAFTLVSGILFFTTFFLNRMAEMRAFFQYLPYYFAFFVPAITMRVFSEENKSGSFETLVTLPVTSTDIVLGKYLASFISTLALLVPSLFYVIALYIAGSPDLGPLAGGYIGAVFLAAAFSSIGVYSSSLAGNQIISFIVSLGICAFLVLVDIFLAFVPSGLASLVSFISARSHFLSVSRGIIDSRDIIYFLSVTALCLVLTVRKITKARRA